RLDPELAAPEPGRVCEVVRAAAAVAPRVDVRDPEHGSAAGELHAVVADADALDLNGAARAVEGRVEERRARAVGRGEVRLVPVDAGRALDRTGVAPDVPSDAL